MPERVMSFVAMSLGAACMEQDSLAEAGKYFYRATLLDSTNAFAFHNLGLALGYRGDLPRCISALALAVTLAPDQTHWRYLLAQSYYTAGQTDKAYRELNTAIRTDPDYFADSFFGVDST
jgi:tetratricopeptide (TPR) repeat protein